MDNTRLLYDAFNIYYEKGMESLKTNNLKCAKLNLYAAAETILKLAKVSGEGVLKAQRLKKAEDLYALTKKIDSMQRMDYSERNNAGKDVEKLIGTRQSAKDKNSSDDSLTNFVPVEKTGITLQDIAGLDEAKEEIRRLIIEPKKHPEIYEKFKRKKGGGILLYGVPGTGKTMLAQAIANEIDAKFYAVKCSDIAAKWFGESEHNVKNLFAEARKQPCSIIFFDEFEALGAKRDSNSTVMKRLVPELLAQIQGFDKSENTLLIIAATNRPWDIDSAFLRPGRFNTSIYVPLPDEKARKYIVEQQLNGVPLSDNVNMEKIVKLTDGFNGADVVEFCDKLKDYAIRRTIESGNESKIFQDDVEYAAKRVKTSVRLDDLKKISAYEQNFN